MRLLVHRLHPDAKLPVCAHPGRDLGYDIHAIEDVFLEPFQQVIVKTGISARFVDDYYVVPAPNHNDRCRAYGLEVEDRSGVAAKNGIHILAGKIDYGWTGEVGVVMILLGLPKQIHPEDRDNMLANGWTEEKLAKLTASDRRVLAEFGTRFGYQITKGDRIAQMLPRLTYTAAPVEEIPVPLPEEGARGTNGYGSTGR